ncbi:MAG: hypothetical protein IKT31_09505 [Firmicutes bacterium]|nr:hypothetical protein [Bacillota bacterium]
MKINTVCGKIDENDFGIILPHEHICCYFEPYLNMAGKHYLDKEKLLKASVGFLKEMKKKYSLDAIIDCTATNIGRDLELLKKVSEQSGVKIICSTGFYFTDEPMTTRHSSEYMESQILYDIDQHSIGSLKFAVEAEKMTDNNKHLLEVMCQVQKKTNLPLCLHTNPEVNNCIEVLEFVLDRKVAPGAITIGHCSDSEDMGYVSDILSSGCYVGFDRIYRMDDAQYYKKKADDIAELCRKGYQKKILLSHDALIFHGFRDKSVISQFCPFDVIFERLVPELYEKGLSKDMVSAMMSENPLNMLCLR